MYSAPNAAGEGYQSAHNAVYVGSAHSGVRGFMLFYGTTDIGRRRTVNQDNFIIKKYSRDIAVAVVCDGMGGARGGGVASSFAASAFMERLDAESEWLITGYGDTDADERISDLLQSAVAAANRAVHEGSEASEDLSGMGTTLVSALITPRRIYAVNVGDSRMYLASAGSLTQITRDHSYVQYLVDIGKMTPRRAKSSGCKNIITRAVGTESSVEADIYTIERRSDGGTSYILLCTDGLSNMVEPRDISAVLKSMNSDNRDSLSRAAERLTALANERGGVDNITVVLMADGESA